MTLSSVIVQMINGLADASTMFLVAVGLSLIFGVTRIVNFAHGSFYMLGVYVAYSVVNYMGSTVLGFWGSVLLSAVIVAIFGAMIEMIILRRIYRAPELFQLLATFALLLIIKDATLYIWGAEDLFGPRAPGLTGAIELMGQRIPQYDVVLIFIGPVVLGLLWLLLNKTRWGILIRAATQDREMVSALGINQAWLFTSVFALGCLLAGFGGALQGPRVPANLSLDLETIGNAFVVVVVGGMGSISGAFVAALMIAEIKALCIALGQVSIFGYMFSFSKLTLVVEFVVMAVILVIRPWGLMGKPQAVARQTGQIEEPLRPASRYLRKSAYAFIVLLMAVPLLNNQIPYLPILLVEIFIAIVFAASLHFITGPGGMHSFGHAAYFGLGAYAAALAVSKFHLSMEAALLVGPIVAGLGALLFGWFCVRLSGVYLAMLTLAFSQIVWAIIYQWDDFTGGSNGIIGVWPSSWLSSSTAYYYFALVICVAAIFLMRRILFAPFGYAMRAGRDSALRADAIGINVKRIQWLGFTVAGLFCGVAGILFLFSKGSVSPEALSVAQSVDGLVMVMLGGVQTLLGPIVGASVFTWLQDTVSRETDYWQAVLGGIILILVLIFPSGIAGFFRKIFIREPDKKIVTKPINANKTADQEVI